MKFEQLKHRTSKTVLLLVAFGITLLTSCDKEFEDINFQPDVTIQFAEGGDTSIVNVDKGVLDYEVAVTVQATGPVIRMFEIYEADPRTGNRGALIEETARVFDSSERQYSATYTLSGLTESKCIKVVVTDTLEQVYEKNLFIRITPSVHVSEAVTMETADHYYGSFYASWLSGRVYMRDTEYPHEIDFSAGDVVLPEAGEDAVPALVNPALRAAHNLLTIPGLQNAKFALTDLTPVAYRAITAVDAAPIMALPDPDLDVVQLEVDRVYLFKTENGKKGLIHVSALSRKTATVEDVDGGWTERSLYEIGLTTKTVVE